ncbi:pentatricopeptide repeat-containing protein At1g08070, chloroplastic-like [Humulus lupulus]|uniref:pentatricopeptide repeat-containing protein At1g08070, chloroplastic-like n=1 Tax=Humulus lupulus TaxID=3486 RepID=UPI002B416CD4|nr:pentatricopeptide repeat-containing protein At1g08070, chloroplastic-like [Humulus lupulus]
MEAYMTALLNQSLHLNQLKQLHALIITEYTNLAPIFVKKLLDSRAIEYGRKVFDKITQPDQFLFNSLVRAYSKLSLNQNALAAFSSMHRSGIRVACFAFPSVIKSCLLLKAVGVGKQVHCLAINYGFDSSVFVQTALMDFYAKCDDLVSARKIFDGILIKDPICYNCLISGYSKSGDLEAARRLFDVMPERTVVSWNSIISSYAQNGQYHEGLRIFERMQAEKFCPNEITLVSLLSICAKLGDLEMGLRIKKYINESSLHQNMIVSTAILEMYVKCGAVDAARKQFDKMNRRDIVTWSAIIAGYAQNGRPSESVELFELMVNEKIKPNDVALVSALSACSQLGLVEVGQRIGAYAECQRFASNVYVRSALLDMYSKFGHIDKARRVFSEMQLKDIVSWNSMIAGLAVNGCAEESIFFYEKMKKTTLRPNSITFLGLLTACSHGGLVKLGLEFFRNMKSQHGISPEIEHHACIVDLFCRSGRLKEAFEFICRMKVEPNAVIWGTLLSSSRINLNVKLAEISLKKLLELEPDNAGNYVLLSNIYASEGRWQEALKVRNLMKDRRMKKEVAYSCIAVDNELHKFLVGDTSHSKSSEVYSIVNELAIQLTSAD